MLGTLRLILALAVAASHVDYRIHGLNPGVSAVVGFYLISGYVMAGLLNRHYPRLNNAGAFYLDRAVRLMPQYLLYALLTLLWFRLTPSLPENASLAYFLHASAGVIEHLNNLLVVPLNYYMWNGSDRFTLIPPAWSLGAEIQFYLIAPLILCVPARIHWAMIPALAAATLALLGVINSDWFAYRLLPGVLTYFFLGALLQHLHREHKPRQAWTLAGIVLLSAGLLAWVASRQGSLHQPYNQEVLIGLALFFPLLQLLAQQRRRAFDEWAGDISYGVFLNHFLVHWALYPQGVGVAQLPVFLAICIFFAWSSQRWIERPCLAWRKRFRKSTGRLLQ